MKAFVLAVGSNKLLFESDTKDPDGKRVIGAFIPGVEGNYYQELQIGFREKDAEYSMGFESWWKWMRESIARGDTLIDEEYSFDPEEVRIIPFNIELGA